MKNAIPTLERIGDRLGDRADSPSNSSDLLVKPAVATDVDAPREVDPRNHVEICAAPNFAAVSDKGLKHSDNQDAVALATVEILVSPVDIPPIYVAVVCDGVSSSQSGSVASAAAAKAACAALERTFTRNPDALSRGALHDAICQANRAVYSVEIPAGSEKDPPATTIVAAVVQDGNATIGWIGDSRAYWVTDTEAGLLTRDDSWVNAMIDAGRMTEEESLTHPNLHALYRCLGGETDIDIVPISPTFSTLRMEPGTRLVLCSDGFWNYASGPEDVARVVRQTPIDDPLRTAKHLVNFAIVSGGQDNITVSVLTL